MIRVAVCDDDINFSKKFGFLVKELFSNQSIENEISVFDGGTDFLSRSKAYDAVFLDIAMPNIDGFDIAEQMAEQNSKALIIFVTEHDELVYSSLKFHPFRFIRKSRLSVELPEVLDDVIKELLKASDSKKLTYVSKGKYASVEIKKIEYVDVIGHYLHIHISGGKVIKIYGSLENISNRLTEQGFIRIHKSFLINSEHIAFYKDNQVFLKSGTNVPVSRNRMRKFKSECEKFGRADI